MTQEFVTVTAVKAFPHRGRDVAIGDSLAVTPVEALALTYQRKAKFTTPLARHLTRALSAEAKSTPEKPDTRRRYRRRDLQAEE